MVCFITLALKHNYKCEICFNKNHDYKITGFKPLRGKTSHICYDEPYNAKMDKLNSLLENGPLKLDASLFSECFSGDCE